MPGGLRITLTFGLLLLISAAGVQAQDGGQQPQGSQQTQGTTASPQITAPAPPPGLGTPPQVPENPEGAPLATDTRPLAGAQSIIPTLPNAGRSFIIPQFSVWEGADTNAMLTPGVAHTEAASIPVAAFDLHVLGQHNTFDADAGGGGLIYESTTSNDSIFGDFSISDQYTARRWNVFVADRGTYLPQSAAGFGGFGFAGVFNNVQTMGLGTGASELTPAYAPESSIIAGRFGTSSETGIAQVQYFLTPRTSASVLGSFGYQYYSQTGLISGNDRYGSASVDHQLTPTQTISFTYSASAFRYSGGSVAVSDNLWRVGWGYRVTNHFTLTLLGGPELTYSAIRGVFGVKERLSWAGQGGLGYRGQRGGIRLSYMHYLTPGSGVFQGAQTSLASVSVNRELTRTWTADLIVGWSNNSALGTYSVNPFFINAGTVNTEFGSLRVSHHIGRSLQAFAVYDLQREESGSALVTGGNSRLLVRHIFGGGLEWHPRPFGL